MATWTDGQKFHGIDGWQPKIRTRNKHKSNKKNFTRSSVTDGQKQQKHKCYAAMPCIEAARAVASETQRPQSQEERKILFEHLQQETQAREILRMRNSILAKNCITQLAKKQIRKQYRTQWQKLWTYHNHIENGKIKKYHMNCINILNEIKKPKHLLSQVKLNLLHYALYTHR